MNFSRSYECGIKIPHSLYTWIRSYKILGVERLISMMTKGRNTTYEERVEIVSYCIEHGNNYKAAIEK